MQGTGEASAESHASLLESCYGQLGGGTWDFKFTYPIPEGFADSAFGLTTTIKPQTIVPETGVVVQIAAGLASGLWILCGRKRWCRGEKFRCCQ